MAQLVEDVSQLHADDEAGHAQDDVAPEQHVNVMKEVDHQLSHLKHQLSQVHKRPWWTDRELSVEIREERRVPDDNKVLRTNSCNPLGYSLLKYRKEILSININYLVAFNRTVICGTVLTFPRLLTHSYGRKLT